MHVNPIKLGVAIRELREHRNFTQQDIAEKLDVTINYLSLVENGKRGMSLPNLNKLAVILDIPSSFIFFLGSDQPKNKDGSQLMEKIKELVKGSLELTSHS